MCEADGSLIASFEIYREYEERIQAKREEINEAPTLSERRYLTAELRMLEDDFIIYGYKYEHINQVVHSYSLIRDCIE
jgi:hypothetical protein